MLDPIAAQHQNPPSVTSRIAPVTPSAALASHLLRHARNGRPVTARVTDCHISVAPRLILSGRGDKSGEQVRGTRRQRAPVEPAPTSGDPPDPPDPAGLPQ